LVERGGRKALIETLQQPKKKCQEKTDIHESKERIRAHIDYFLRSNKSNINQYTCIGYVRETPGCVEHIKCTGPISGSERGDRNR